MNETDTDKTDNITSDIYLTSMPGTANVVKYACWKIEYIELYLVSVVNAQCLLGNKLVMCILTSVVTLTLDLFLPEELCSPWAWPQTTNM